MPDHEMHRRTFLGALATTAALPLAGRASAAADPAGLAYVGSFTSSSPAGKGLQVAAHDAATGEIRPQSVVDGVPDASFLALSPDGRVLYTTNEQQQGAVTALSLADPARPRVLGSVPTGGAGPTHLSVHPAGHLLVANYTDGTVSAHPLQPDGAIGPASSVVRHEAAEPHAHQVLPAPAGRLVTAVDLGADAVFVYSLDNGRLVQQQRLDLPAGTGPRHLAWHPGGERAYLVAELNSTITVLDWDGARFTAGQVLSTRAAGAGGRNAPAEIATTRDGRFVYASNRGDDDIAVFAVRGDRLERLGSTPTGGQWPRHFALAPDESAVHVVNQNSGTLTRLPRDPATGALAPSTSSAPFTAAAVLAFAG